MSEPTPEAVEAAARAMFADMCCDSENPEVCATQWDDALDQEMWLEQAAAALSAAAPYLIREAQAQALEDAAEEWARRSLRFLETMQHMVESREHDHDDILRYGAYSAEAQVSGHLLRARARAIRDGHGD